MSRIAGFEKIRIGYLPTRRALFNLEETKQYRDLIRERISTHDDVELIGIEDVAEEGLLLRYEDMPRVIDKMRAQKVDALFFPHCNFGCEDAVITVASALRLPTLIYGPRDHAPDVKGGRARDSQCGLFATGKGLRVHSVPFSYLTNVDPSGAQFMEGFDKFVRVAAVVKAMRTMRILQFGPRPNDFLSVIVNEGELAEKFGVHLFPVALPDLTKEVKSIIAQQSPEFKALCEQMRGRFCGSSMKDDANVGKFAGLKLAITSFARKFQCNCAAIQCWDALQDELGIFPCAVNAMLSEDGFPVACETDIHGAISAVLLQAATGNHKPHFLADITIRHPEDDNVELLWHCGPFPACYAKDPDNLRIEDNLLKDNGCGGNCYWPIQEGPITVCRFDGDHGKYSLLIGEGEGVDGPYTAGTYVWFKTKDWPLWEHRLVQGPYIHHVAGTYANVADVLYEACRYFDALTADPIEPNAAELEKRWRL